MGPGTRRRDGLDDGRLTQFPAQHHDDEPHHAGERVDVLIPRLLEEVLGRHYAAIGPEQFLEHDELLARQPHRLAVASHRAAMWVQPDAGALQDRRGGGPGSPAQCLDPRHQLGELERLGEVVIGAEPKPRHPLGNGGGSGEHQDPSLDARVNQGGAHLVAGHDGQIAVEDHDVVVVDREAVQGSIAVIDDVHGHALATQPAGDGVGEQPLILDHQHSHSPIVARAALGGC